MTLQTRIPMLLSASCGVIVLAFTMNASAAIDAEAAKKLARKDSCLRCHAADIKKEGPSFKAIASKYNGQADALEKLVKHITSGVDRVKLSDGHEEIHKFDTAADISSITNLIEWILAQ
jgi:cytochrome c